MTDAESSATRTLERSLDHGAPRLRVPIVTVELLASDGPVVRELADQQSFTVGREFPSQLALREPHLSRQHARFVCEGGRLRVEDLGSKNGTFVRGTQVSRAYAEPGDEVLLASLVVLVRSPEAQSPSLLGYERWHASLLEACQRALSQQRPLSVLMLRMEGSSTEVGRSTREVVEALTDRERAARFSPGTLAIMLDGTTSLGARAWAATLLARLSGGAIKYGGVAGLREHAMTHEELVARAHAASREAPCDSVGLPEGQLPTDNLDAVIVSPATQRTYDLARRVARSTAPVLINGETGVGKERIARLLHTESARSSGPWRVLNCGALPPHLVESILFGHERGAFTGADRLRTGAFEEADGGTLFLDEIGELPIPAQAALLRVLEARSFSRVGSTKETTVDVRVVTATHRDLAAMSRCGAFRADLFHRLNVVEIEVAPLRERREEIAPLAERFLREAQERWRASACRISEDALTCLQAYDWPGNVRELRNVIERAALTALTVCVERDDLPAMMGSPPANADTPGVTEEGDADGALPERVRDFELRQIVSALEQSGGNQRKAAATLQVPLRTLVYKLRALNIGR